MNWQETWNARRRRAIWGALICAALTWVCEQTRFYDGLANASYDWTFLLQTRAVPDDVLLIYMDEKSAVQLGQSAETWDRALHAQLIDQLHKAGARLVVFDVWFSGPGSAVTNRMLAEAIRRHGAVVLAGVGEDQRDSNVAQKAARHSEPEFEAAAAAMGIAGLVKESVARRYYAGNDRELSLPHAAARLIQPALTNLTWRDLSGHWLNYYGPPETFRSMSYVDALMTNQPTAKFAGKYVFIGAWLNTDSPGAPPDKLRTPYNHWKNENMPGVDLVATAFVNLLRQEWLTRLNDTVEEWLLVVLGALVGFGLGTLRFPANVWLAAALALAAPVLGTLGAVLFRVWTPWLVLPLFQLPVALVWLRLSRRGLQSLPDRATVLEAAGQDGAAGTPALMRDVEEGTAVTRTAPRISDHTLLRCIGRGSYGEVWLARDAIGTFHAVKVIHRSSFPSAVPFEREYHGMQKFTPLSRNHPGWIHVLHVGRNEAEGYFFYVMELADDEVTGQEIVPETYRPRNLAGELKTRGRLPLEECVEIGVALADALDYLHGHLLVHRDIKPSNVIYVHGSAKFTDVGLVTEVRNRDRDVSMLGTEGYMAPEGPGTAAADIYSLGKLLYEISTGRDRFAFPAVPGSLLTEGATPMGRWQELVARACNEDPSQRQASAAGLRDDLLLLRTAPR